MSRSEIFDSFVKIAQEKGMISNDSDKIEKKLEQTLRADSLSLSDIEALYGVKPDLPKNMEYERNIIENAHPNSVVVAPAYDKLNGLVENNNERQDILLHIVNKTPDGLLTQRKYAEQELINTLISAANDLDNKDNNELRKLADTCLLQICSKKKVFKKEALAPLTIGILVAIPLAIGALWLQQNLKFANEGFEKNHQKLMEELDDMISSSVSWGVGIQYKQSLISMVTGLKEKLMNMYGLFKKVEPIINQLEKPRTAEELIEISKQPKTKEALNAFNTFYKASYNMLSYIETIQANFKSEEFKARQIEDKGWLQKLVDRTQIFHGGKGMIADDFDDVNRAIPPYLESIKQILDIFKNGKSVVDKAKADLAAAQKEAPSLFGTEMDETPSAPTTPAAPSSPATPEAGKSQLHSDLEEMAGKVPGLSALMGR